MWVEREYIDKKTGVKLIKAAVVVGGVIENIEYKNQAGRFHRSDGPSDVYYHKDGTINVYFESDGFKHNDSGPYFIAFDQKGHVKSESYGINGKNIKDPLQIAVLKAQFDPKALYKQLLTEIKEAYDDLDKR